MKISSMKETSALFDFKFVILAVTLVRQRNLLKPQTRSQSKLIKVTNIIIEMLGIHSLMYSFEHTLSDWLNFIGNHIPYLMFFS